MSGNNSKDKKLKEYFVEEVSTHNTMSSVWLIISDEVFDVTKFLADHPGGTQPIMNMAGKESTDSFMNSHSIKAKELINNYKTGFIKTIEKKVDKNNEQNNDRKNDQKNRQNNNNEKNESQTSGQ